MTKIKDIETALNLFEKAAAEHAVATEQGNYKTGNKCYSFISEVITFLKEKNEILSLMKCLSHESIGVRMWAATYLLPCRENDAIKVLEEIAEGSGILSFTAKTTLNEWRKGNLKL